MVILGGLELVAAGVILHKFNKDKERQVEQEEEERQRRRERKHDRKHNSRHDSRPHYDRPQKTLYPPQQPPQRAHSAPPPGYPPTWQPQSGYYPPQQWQAQQNTYTPAWQPQQSNFNPAWQPSQNKYPPTWQPPQTQAQAQPYTYPQSQHSLRKDIEATPSEPTQSSLSRQSSVSQFGFIPEPPPPAAATPYPNCAELSADSPGPHQGHLQQNPRYDPPPAYRD